MLLLLLHAARGGRLKEGVREEEGLGDADGEKEEEERGQEAAGERCPAGHAAAPAAGPRHAAVVVVYGLVGEVVGMGWEEQSQHDVGKGGVGGARSWDVDFDVVCLFPSALTFTYATRNDAPHTETSINKPARAHFQKSSSKIFTFACFARATLLSELGC